MWPSQFTGGGLTKSAKRPWKQGAKETLFDCYDFSMKNRNKKAPRAQGGCLGTKSRRKT